MRLFDLGCFPFPFFFVGGRRLSTSFLLSLKSLPKRPDRNTKRWTRAVLGDLIKNGDLDLDLDFMT